MLFDETQRDDERGCQRIWYAVQCTDPAMHSLPIRPFAVLITGECVHQRLMFHELTTISLLFLIQNSSNIVQRQLTLTQGPDCTDSESSFYPRLNSLSTWWEWTLNLRDNGVICGGVADSSHFVERHIFVGKNAHAKIFPIPPACHSWCRRQSSFV